MDKLMKKLCDALEDIEKSSSVNIMDTADRRLVSELVDLKKNLLKVEKLEDEMDGGMSMAGYSSRRHRYSRAGDEYGDSYARRRDSMGRYSRDALMDHVDRMMSEAPDEHTRDKIRRFRQELENA